MTLPLSVCADGSVGLGWRPETAWLIDRKRVSFSEVIAENIDPRQPPRALAAAIERGLVVITHGVGLSLGGAEPPDRERIDRLAAVARTLRSPLVSEHVAFVRARDIAGKHFLPVPRTRTQLAVLVDHVRRVVDRLPVPLALENVAAPLAWPDDELAEADFLAELVERTGAHLLLDVANLRANVINHGGDSDAYLARLPLERIAYMHVAGGARVDAMWRDTHAHAIDDGGLDLLARVLARTGPRPILLERDHAFGTGDALCAELARLESLLRTTQPVATQPTQGATVELPRLDGIARAKLETRHASLLAAVLAPAGAPAVGFNAMHVDEARAIFARKHDGL